MSISYKLFDDEIIYPPAPGDPGGPCADACAHFDCIQMRKAAAALCPTCVQPMGYGNVMHLKPLLVARRRDSAAADGAPTAMWRVPEYEDKGFREVTNEHEACYQARLEREHEREDVEAQARQDASDALAETDAQGEALAAGERELDA